VDLWTPASQKKLLGYAAAIGLGIIFICSLNYKLPAEGFEYAFDKMYVVDGLALFFKRFFLLAAIIVLIMSVSLPIGSKPALPNSTRSSCSRYRA